MVLVPNIVFALQVKEVKKLEKNLNQNQAFQ